MTLINYIVCRDIFMLFGLSKLSNTSGSIRFRKLIGTKFEIEHLCNSNG